MSYISKPRKSRDSRESRDSGFFNPEISGLEKRPGIGNPRPYIRTSYWILKRKSIRMRKI